jgi:predicted transcriptional regulator
MEDIELESESSINDDEGITSPFSTKDIKITHATILLPSLINRLKHKEIITPDFQRNSDLWTPKVMSRLIESILLKETVNNFVYVSIICPLLGKDRKHEQKRTRSVCT